MALPVLVIISWNANCSALLGLGLNSQLWYLASKYSSTELREYRRLIYSYCILNVIILSLQVLTQPLFLINNEGTAYLFLTGIAAGFESIQWRLILLGAYTFFLFLSLLGSALQFVDRYLLICRQISRCLYRLVLMILLALFLLCLCIILDVSNLPAQPQLSVADVLGANFSQLLAQSHYDWSWPSIGMESHVDNAVTRNCLMLLVCFLLICYLVIVFCYARIRAFIKANLMDKAGHSKRDMIRQISLNMILQATLPLTCICLYALCLSLILARVYSVQLLQFEMLAFVPSFWLPAFSPLAAMLTIRDYRTALVENVLCAKKGPVGINSNGGAAI